MIVLALLAVGVVLFFGALGLAYYDECRAARDRAEVRRRQGLRP